MSDAVVSIIPEMKRKTIEAFVEKAQANDVELKEVKVAPISLVTIGKDEIGNAVVTEREDIAHMSEKRLQKGDSICLDFGDHHAGYVTLKLKSAGSPQDAPAFLRLKFTISFSV